MTTKSRRPTITPSFRAAWSAGMWERRVKHLLRDDASLCGATSRNWVTATQSTSGACDACLEVYNAEARHLRLSAAIEET